MKLIEKYKSAKRKIHIRRNKMKMRNIPKLKGVRYLQYQYADCDYFEEGFRENSEKAIDIALKERDKQWKKEILKSMQESKDIDDTIWFDDVTTLYDEIVLRMEK